ncbi:MAG TPA: hypothetical protein VMS98_20260 [Thermoanaerobaculia bacterium]|nr:hypothetical protein [Thermoanaerobaculia bacterium]
MKWIAVVAAVVVTTTAVAEVPVQRVADDARVIDRVAQISKRDLPGDLLKRLVNEDIELLRGKRADGSYEYATHERLEQGRTAQDFSLQPKKDEELQRIEIKGSFVYRLIVSSPTRRLLVARNRRVWVDRIDIEYIATGTLPTRNQSVKVEEWMSPGDVKPIDLPEVARQATVRVYGRGDREAGYGNLVLTLVEAKVVDNADSPYAEAVASARAILRAIDKGEVPSIRAMAARMYDSLASKLEQAPRPAATAVEVIAPGVEESSTPGSEMHAELQEIEDLLTGSESERREGLDRLHQLVRQLRPR